MSVRITALDDVGDINADVGSVPWLKAYALKTRRDLRNAEASCGGAKERLDTLDEYDAWRKLRCLSYESFVDEFLGTNVDFVDLVRVANDHDKIGSLMGHGGNRRSEGFQRSNRTLKRGTTQEYQLARLARDAPDILDALQRGEYPSVRQAAIAAGIIKLKTPAQAAATALSRPDADLREFVQLLPPEMRTELQALL